MRNSLVRFMWVPVLALALSGLVRAEAPELLSYQGVLTRTDGTVLPNATYLLTFRIYDHPTLSDGLLFEQALQVAVVDGLYNVILSGNELGGASIQEVFSATSRFMQVTIGANPAAELPADVTLFPRQQIASVPFALVANKARELDPPPLDPIPQGALILWDQSDICPTGFVVASEFQGLTIRGADLSGASADIPDSAGVSCDGIVACSGGGNAERFDDHLQVTELASHNHNFFMAGDFRGPSAKAASQGDVFADPGFAIPTSSTGEDTNHYHPVRTVLFCRKD